MDRFPFPGRARRAATATVTPRWLTLFSCLIALTLALAGCGPRFRLSALPTAPVSGAVSGGPGVSGVAADSPGLPAAPAPQGAAAAGIGGSTGGVASGRAGGTSSNAGTGTVVRGGVIKVGGIFPLTGGLSALGKPAFQGAQAYFNDLNAHGGIAGRKIQFIACDDQADDTRTTTCAKKLVEQDGVFAMGPSFTPFSLTVINQLAKAGVPWIGYDGINVEGFSARNVVTIGAPIEAMAHGLVPYWYTTYTKEHGHAPKRIGAIVLDSGPAQTYLREAKQVLCPKLGCEIVKEETVGYTTTQYSTICRGMQSQGVDAIWIITDPASAIKVYVGCSAAGIDPKQIPFLGQHGIFLDLTLRQAGSYAAGTRVNSALLPPAVRAPATDEMRRIITTYYPDAEFGYFTELSYASARMFADTIGAAIAAGGDLTRTSALNAAAGLTHYDCHGLCKDVNLAPPASRSGGNHNIWIVRADFSSGTGRWVYEAGPIDAYKVSTWPCPGRARPC